MYVIWWFVVYKFAMFSLQQILVTSYILSFLLLFQTRGAMYIKTMEISITKNEMKFSNSLTVKYSIYPNMFILQYMLPLLITIQLFINCTYRTNPFNSLCPAVCIGAATTSSTVSFQVEMTQITFINTSTHSTMMQYWY